METNFCALNIFLQKMKVQNKDRFQKYIEMRSHMLLRQLSKSAREKLVEYSDTNSLNFDTGINEPQTFFRELPLGTSDMNTPVKVLPLHIAIEHEDPALVKELCEHKADVCIQIYKRDAMAFALDLYSSRKVPSNKIIEIVNILLEQKPEWKTDKGVEALFKRHEESKDNIGKILSQSSIKTLTGDETFDESEKFNKIGKCGLSPLHYAARIGDEKLIRELCDIKADVNLADENKKTPLEYAAENGLSLVVRALLESKQKHNDDSISRAHASAHHYKKSCLWSSFFWKSYKKISGKGVVNYDETTKLLNSAAPMKQ
jgi:ankyrin repeat protein